MKRELHRAIERGSGDFGWLKPNYYFSFSGYQNPRRMHFGALRVLNDDWIAGGGQFPPHPHDNMEIVTIPLSGAVRHQDNTGGEGLIQAGDVQIMSAGSGIVHAEANASPTEPLTLFQIWLFPKVADIPPRYDQRRFSPEGRLNRWQVVVSPREEDQALWINQDARFSLSDYVSGEKREYRNAFAGNGVFLVVVNGEINVEGDVLQRRDAIAISETDRFLIEAREDSQLLAIEVPMRW